MLKIPFYILCFEIISINNLRTTTLFKLNSEQTKIIEAENPTILQPSFNSYSNSLEEYDEENFQENDPIFNIITSTVHFTTESTSKWIRKPPSQHVFCIHDCQNGQFSALESENLNISHKVENVSSSNQAITNFTNNNNVSHSENFDFEERQEDEHLDCGKPVNFTYYDNLVGVLNRHKHQQIAEPHAAFIFTPKNKKFNNFEVDLEALEKRLKKAKKEKPKSVQLYNQLGNFHRIKGDPQNAIECFRRALAVSPHNSQVLLNLARLLFTHQYLDDAIYLTRRSLESTSNLDKSGSGWQQYFTLGEILKAYGHYQEAAMHLRHTLELKPNFEPAQVALREMEAIMPAATVHIYTLVIIICLVLGVLLVILSNVDGNGVDDMEFQYANNNGKFGGGSSGGGNREKCWGNKVAMNRHQHIRSRRM